MIELANVDLTRLGGGWSFARNFVKAMGDQLKTDAQIYFICGASMVNRQEVMAAKEAGKKIVLRVDNALLPANNRGGGMTHMRDYAALADLVIYQSKWARDYLRPYLGKTGPVILNAVDLAVFNDIGRRPRGDRVVYGYSRSSRHETKMWEAARYYYSKISQAPLACELWILGHFSPDFVEYNFNFYAGERYRYLGQQPHGSMPDWYRQIDTMIIPFFNDACSNTLIEALCCGCTIYENPFLKTGGTPEILAAFKKHGPEYFGLERLRADYTAALAGLQ